jgi:hypothetical protein
LFVDKNRINGNTKKKLGFCEKPQKLFDKSPTANENQETSAKGKFIDKKLRNYQILYKSTISKTHL